MTKGHTKKPRKLNKLWIDQYGNRFWAKTITQLKADRSIPGAIFKIYFEDAATGETFQTGWGIGKHWFDVYTPMRKEC